VHAVGIRRDRHVDAVVDDYGDATRPAQLQERKEKVAARSGLLGLKARQTGLAPWTLDTTKPGGAHTVGYL
jgi:hypothetical protein